MRPPGTKPNRHTLIHHAPPKLKLGAALALVVASTLLPQHLGLPYLVPGALLALLWWLCRMPCTYALRRLLLAEVFVLGIALMSLVVPASAPHFIPTLLKSTFCIVALLLLTWTTPFHEILLVLRQLHLPPVMLTTLALMYRYLPVLAEETRRMERARASRTFSPRHRLAWQNLATILGQLFVRTADRAERIYLAMCARGWKL